MSPRVIAQKSDGLVVLYGFLTVFFPAAGWIILPHLDFHEVGTWLFSLFCLFGLFFSTFHLIRLLYLPKNLVVENGDILSVYTGFGKNQVFSYDEITSLTIFPEVRYGGSGTIMITTRKGDAVISSCMDAVGAYGVLVEERAKRKAKAEFERAGKGEGHDSIND